MGNKPHNNKRPTTNNGSRRSPGHRGRIPDRLQGHEGMHAIWGVPYGNLNSHDTQEQQAASSFVDESATFVASAGPIGAQEGNATARSSPTTSSPLPDPPSGPSTSKHRDTVQTFLPQCATTSFSQPVEDLQQINTPSAAQENYGLSQGELTPSATSTPLSSALSGPPPRYLSESFPSFDARGAYTYEATPRSIPNLPAATNAVGYPNDYGSVALSHVPLVFEPSFSDSSSVPRGMRSLQSLSYRNALEALIQNMTNETNATPRAAPTLPPLSPPGRLFPQSALEAPGSGTVNWFQQGASATPCMTHQPYSTMATRRGASRSSHERRLANSPYPLPSRAPENTRNDTHLYGLDVEYPFLGFPDRRGVIANANSHPLEHIRGTPAPVTPYPGSAFAQGIVPQSPATSTGPYSTTLYDGGAASFDGSSITSPSFSPYALTPSTGGHSLPTAASLQAHDMAAFNDHESIGDLLVPSGLADALDHPLALSGPSQTEDHDDLASSTSAQDWDSLWHDILGENGLHDEDFIP